MSLLRDIGSSFYSGRFYAELAHQRKGVGIVYVLVLTFLTMLILSAGSLHTFPQVRKFVDSLPEKVDQFPALTYKDSKLTLDKPTPYTLSIGEGPQSVWMIIDPNYPSSNIDDVTKFMRDNKFVLLLTNDKLFVLKAGQDELDVRDLKKVGPFSVTHETLHNIAEIIRDWGIVLLVGIFCVTLFIGLIIGHFVGALCVAVVVRIATFAFRGGLDFAACMRLAAALRIPTSLLPLLPLLIGRPSFTGILPWLVWIVYVGYAVWASKHFKSIVA